MIRVFLSTTFDFCCHIECYDFLFVCLFLLTMTWCWCDLLLCLNRSAVFYYSSGTVFGVFMTLVFVLLMAKRNIPKVGRYLLRQWAESGIRALTDIEKLIKVNSRWDTPWFRCAPLPCKRTIKSVCFWRDGLCLLVRYRIISFGDIFVPFYELCLGRMTLSLWDITW